MVNASGQMKTMRLNLTAGNPAGTSIHNVTGNVNIGANQQWRLVDLFGDGRKYFYTKLSSTQHYAARVSAFSFREWTWSGGHNEKNGGWEVGDLFGDGRASYYTHLTSGGHYVTRFSSAHPDLLTKVTNGLGHETDIAYQPITDNSAGFYTKGTNAVYPARDLRVPLQVVAQVDGDNGLGGDRTETFSYSGARVDLNGRGFTGFQSIARHDNALQITTTTDYEQTWPYIGGVARVETSHSGSLLSRTTNTYGAAGFGGSHHFTYLANRLEETWELNGTALPTRTLSNQYDCAISTTNCYGNLDQSTVSTSDGYSATTVNTYWNDSANWFVGKLTRSEETSDGVTRTKAFEYNLGNGVLSKEIVEPDNTQLRLDTSYTRNATGNITNITVSSPATGLQAIQSRTRTIGYDSRDRFPVSVTNEEGHTETRQYDTWFGVVFDHDDPNALQTLNYHNDLGFNYKTKAPDDTVVRRSWSVCGTSCPTNGAYYMIMSPLDASETTLSGRQRKIFYDNLDRVIREEYEGYDGSGTAPLLVESTEYDNAGRVYRKSRPYVNGSSNIQWTTYSYDALSRITSEARPDGSHTDSIYNGLATTIRAYQNIGTYEQTVTTVDGRGQRVKVTDDNGQDADYEYDGFSNLIRISLNTSYDTTMQYDLLGRKTQMDDPDKGLWSYVYNAAGELVQQTDAKAQVASFSYDKLGRMTQRVEVGLTSDWYYDAGKGGATCANGIGKLCEEETNSGYSRIYNYDSLSRSSSIQTTLDSTVYTASVTYDASSRIDTVTYPSGLVINNDYTLRGFHNKVTDSSGSFTYWEATAVDAEDRVTQANLGNGININRSFDVATGRLTSQVASQFFFDAQNISYGYDWLGNVTARNDNVQTTTESLSYDGLSRVTNTTGLGVPTLNFGYDNEGNLTSKSDVGSYSYSGTATRPHAVTQVTGTVNATFSYDSNGNMLSGNGRTFTWTSYDQPATITKSGQTTSFAYDTAHQRFKKTVGNNTTHYLNLNPVAGSGLFYEKETSGGQTTHRNYISAAGRVVAVVEKVGITQNTYYWHQDVLGSLNVVTDGAGLAVQRCDYNAFGDRTCSTGTPQFDRGYTGHEHMDDLGLINMNGRLYDPQLARFISADSVVPEPYNTQSYNRFSYVNNSPFRYTDPSGFTSQALSDAKLVFGSMATGVSEASNAVLEQFSLGNSWLLGLTTHQLSQNNDLSLGAMGQGGSLGNLGVEGGRGRTWCTKAI